MSVRNRVLACAAGVVALLTSVAAHAGGPPRPLAEPGTWALAGLAVVIGVAVMRNRRK